MPDADALPLQKCANLRCSQEFQPGREWSRFCCSGCRIQWRNLMRAGCTEAIEMLIEHRTQPRLSKAERARRNEIAKRLGKPPLPIAKKGLLTKAMRIVDQFIQAERDVRDNPELASAPRPWRIRD
jgi:hypothetical protein